MRIDFKLRIYNAPEQWFKEIRDITISGITLISKDGKFGICMHKGNQKKFKYTIELSKKFNKAGGSHNYPDLTFKGEYIDVIVKDFPRYPCFTQCKYHARNVLNGYGHNGINDGYPYWLEKNKVEFIKL
jgi:hypothetical protein